MALTKDCILEEIRRVAAALGRAPGRTEFFDNSGIKETDWSGRYWARRGDALRDAGCEPNQLNAAYSTEYIVSKMVQLIRELERFPTRAEMRLKRRSDRGFPDANVYYRLGSRAATFEFIRD